MFKLSFGSGSNTILTAEQVASSIYKNISVKTGGFICGRMAYMSNYQEAIQFTSEEELVQALNQYITKHNIHSFDYKQVKIYYKSTALYYISFDIPESNQLLDSRDLRQSAILADSKALKVFKKLHPKDKGKVVTKEPAKVFLVN